MSFWEKLESIFKKPNSGSGQQVSKSFAWKSEWDFPLKSAIESNLKSLSGASDILKLRGDYNTLNDEQKCTVWFEFFKTLAYYESSYNPDSQNVDVGKANNRDTWSIGLLQVSVIDQVNYGLHFGFNFADLLVPENNLKFGVAVLANQVKKRGKIFIPNDEKGNPKAYFATLRPGNKYSKVDQILATVEALRFVSDFTENLFPWMKIAEAEEGQSEIVGSEDNPRIVEYHQATTLKAKDDETAWCASFVCWVLQKAGYKSTRSAWARDYLDYGKYVKTPSYGCICVFKRNETSGHVGFYVGEDKDNILVLGGNQLNAVRTKWYKKSDLLGYRWPVK